MKVENTQVVFIMYQSQLRVSQCYMRKWRQWMKRLSWTGNEFKEQPAFAVLQQKQYKVTTISVSNLPALWYFFFYCNFVSSFPPLCCLGALISPYSSSFIPVWFWLLRCRQCWQVKQQGRWAGSNAKLLACLKRRGKGKKPASFPLEDFLAGRLISSRDIRSKMRIPSRECICSKTASFTFNGAVLHSRIFKQ